MSLYESGWVYDSATRSAQNYRAATANVLSQPCVPFPLLYWVLANVLRSRANAYAVIRRESIQVFQLDKVSQARLFFYPP